MSIKRRSIRGSFFLTIGTGLSQLVNFITILVVANYLIPSEYGVFTYGVISISFIGILARFGLTEAIIQHQALDGKQLFSTFLLSFLLAIFATVIMILVGLFFSWFKSDIQYIYIFSILSVSVFSLGLQSVPESLLRRNLNFSILAAIRALASLISAGSAIIMLYYGYGIWAIVLQRVVHEVIILVILLIKTNLFEKIIPNTSFNFKLLRFGKNIASFNFVDVFSGHIDQIIVAAFLGEYALGVYSFAKRIMHNIRRLLFTPIRQVSISAFSIAKKSQIDIPVSYRNSLRMASMFGVAVFFLLVIGIDNFIAIILSNSWEGVGIVVTILSVLVLYDSIVLMFPAVMQSHDKPHWLVYERLAIGVIGVVALFVGVNYGPQGVAFAVVFQYMSTIFLPLAMIARLIKVKVSESFLECVPYFICGVISALLVFLVNYSFKFPSNEVINLCINLIMFLVLYIILCYSLTKTFKRDVGLIISSLAKNS